MFGLFLWLNDRNDPRGYVGIRGSILYVHKRNEPIVPTLVLFQLISGPRDEIERERVGACVIPKADSKFWTGDHSIHKSYIKGIQCSFRFWTYHIHPPILSSLHISFMCSQSISTLIKLTEKSINIQQRPINIVGFVCTPRFVFKQRWFPICFQPRECACSRACSSYYDFATYSQSNSNFLSSLSNSTSGVLTTSVVECAVLIVLPPSIYIRPKSKSNKA